MSFVPRAQEIYQHFKGNLYQIVTVAEHTETGEALVVYQAMYGEFKVYARPLSMFCSKVDRDKYPEANQEYRFELRHQGQKDIPVGQEEVEAVTEATETVELGKAAKTIESTEVREPGEVATVAEVVGEELPEEEASLDPMLLAFLDAQTYAEKLNILASMHHRITDDMITTMAIASDIEIGEGDLDNRYNQLKNCLLTLDKYEITRLR